MVRDGLKRLINDQQDMEVVAEAGDGPEALRLAESLLPAVALVDVSIPGWDGVRITQTLTRTCPGTKVIAVTRHDDAAFVRRLLEAGAAGYVLKQSPSAELTRAVRAVAAGERYVDPSVRSARPPLSRAPAQTAPPGAPCERITDLEEQVLRLLASSYSNQQIAERLAMDVAEVADTKASAMRKTGVMTRLQVIQYARARGWVDGG